jgi:hypothetical protein
MRKMLFLPRTWGLTSLDTLGLDNDGGRTAPAQAFATMLVFEPPQAVTDIALVGTQGGH